MTEWKNYRACPKCGATAAEPCLVIGPGGVTRPGRYRVKGAHSGRPRRADASAKGVRDPELYSHRLAVWRQRARRGDRVEDIAAELRMKRSALDQFVVRARRDGHQDAVYHANARTV